MKRMELRIDDELYDQFKHFAEKQGTSVNQCMQDAMSWYMKYVYRDYDLPTAETVRLNQICEAVEGLQAIVANNTEQTKLGFKSVLGVMRGSSYLESDEKYQDN